MRVEVLTYDCNLLTKKELKMGKITILLLSILLSSPCFAISIESLEKTKQSLEVAELEMLKNNTFKREIFGFKQKIYIKELEGNKEHDFLTISTILVFKQDQRFSCHSKNEKCIKNTDFIDFQKAIELTKNYYERLRAIKLENEFVTIYSVVDLEPNNFLKKLQKTGNLAYLSTTIYYKRGTENIREYIMQIKNEIELVSLKYTDDLSDLIKKESRKRLLKASKIIVRNQL